MAKAAKKTVSLSFRDIVLGAESDIIRQALEARTQIDQLIAERQAAYDRIAILENQVEDVLGETGVFPFPAPPLPVAGFDPKTNTVTRSAATVKAAAAALAPATDDDNEVAAPIKSETTGESDEADNTDTDENDA